MKLVAPNMRLIMPRKETKRMDALKSFLLLLVQFRGESKIIRERADK